MKRFFFLAVAATMAFAACNKTEVVYPDGPQEISFTAVSKVATKAPVTGTVFSTDDNMRVSAYLSNAVGNASNVGNYFSNVSFVGNGGSPEYWVGGQYWPLFPSTVNFLAITEIGGEDNTTTTFGTPAASSATVTLSGNNAFAQNDLMYAVGQGVTDGSGPYDAVSMKFNHALSWINFSFKSNIDDKITVKSVELTAAYDGELNVNFVQYNSAVALTDAAVTATWETPTSVVDQFAPNSGYTAKNGAVLLEDASTVYPYGGGLLVVPGSYANRKFVISYQVDGKDFTYTYPVTQTWEEGKKYTYNVTMTLNEIKIAPEVIEWTTVTPATEVPLS